MSAQLYFTKSTFSDWLLNWIMPNSFPRFRFNGWLCLTRLWRDVTFGCLSLWRWISLCSFAHYIYLMSRFSGLRCIIFILTDARGLILDPWTVMHVTKHGLLESFYFLITATTVSSRNGTLSRRWSDILYNHCRSIKYFINVSLINEPSCILTSAVLQLVSNIWIASLIFEHIVLIMQVWFLSILLIMTCITS
jgi:hypothetical protein